MGKKWMYYSDQSEAVIPEGQGARVTIKYDDGRRPNREADVTLQEADEIASRVNARTVARRGRKPQS